MVLDHEAPKKNLDYFIAMLMQIVDFRCTLKKVGTLVIGELNSNVYALSE